MPTSTSHLLEAAEVWTPAPNDSKSLRQSHGVCREGSPSHPRMEEAAWKCYQSGSPCVLDEDDAFLLALPATSREETTGVLVLACDTSLERRTAVEVWRPTDRHELKLEESRYANLERFARISRYVRFPHGSGLPGEVWNDRFPRIVNNLAGSATFMRGIAAQDAGLDVGVALPVMRNEFELDSVVLLLSTTATPLASVFEIWATNADETNMQLWSGYYRDVPQFRDASARQYYCPGEGLVGKVWNSRRPIVSDQLAQCDSVRADAAAQARLSTAIGLPLFVGTHLRAVFTMYL